MFTLNAYSMFTLNVYSYRSHEDKVHCVLNKADSLDMESLMRVYGALLWSMGKIFSGAEVTRIYVGSFQDKELQRPEFKELFDKDKGVLMKHLGELPALCGMRKVNEMVKRISLNILHVCILGHLRNKMPFFAYGAERVKLRLIDNLEQVFDDVSRTYNIDRNSFPDVKDFKSKLMLVRTYLNTSS